MANIRIKDLPADGAPKQTDLIPIDLGSTRHATVKDVVESGRPTASKTEAELGVEPQKAMTPLTTKQAIDAQVSATYVPKTVKVNAGTGLTGGGALTGDVTVGLTVENVDRLAKVDGIEVGAQVNTVTSVAGKTGAVTLAKVDVGLGNVDNTSDVAKPISTATQNALDGKYDNPSGTTSQYIRGDGSLSAFPAIPQGTVTSVGLTVPAGLSASGSPVTSSGTIAVSYATGYQGYTSAEASKLSGIAAGAQVNTVNSVNTKTGAVVLNSSDVGAAPDTLVPDINANTTARHTHANKAILDATTASFLAAEKAKLTGVEDGAQVNTVTSVSGKTGAVTLAKGDVGLGNVDNTSDANKPISTATQTALNAKANSSVTVSAGAGLTGGGNLTANRSIALNAASIASLGKADTALQALGGSTGQILAKSSAADNDVSWVTSEAATAVSYTQQTLTEAQQSQARSNIGADKDYSSVSSVQSSEIASSVRAIRTNGYHSDGDGGAALYKRVSSEPTHAGKIQSADGAWWELSTNTPCLKMFGAKGDGISDDAPAWNSMVGYAMSFDQSKPCNIEAGVFKFLTDTENIYNITIRGSGVYNCVLRPATSRGIVVNNPSGLAGGVSISNLRIDGTDMPSGAALDIDNVVNSSLEDVIIWNPYDGINLRQLGNLGMRKVIIDGHARGTFLCKAQGSNTMRNGRNDQIDVISFTDCLFQSDYDGSATAPTAEGLVLDGRVHSISFAGMRILSCLRGLHTKNTFGLASNFVPSFFNGFGLETENTYAEGILLEAGTHIDIASVFVARAFRAAGIVIEPDCGVVTFNGVKSGTNYYSGIQNQGAAVLNVINPQIYNNGLVGGNTYPGIHIGGAGTTNIRNGFSGKATWLPTYSEPQKYGIDFIGGYTGLITIDGTDLTGNGTGAIYDSDVAFFNSSSYARNVNGYSASGVVSGTIPASGGSIAAGLRPEYITLFGGTGLVVKINGVPIANSTPTQFILNPMQSAIVTYETAPTLTRNIM